MKFKLLFLVGLLSLVLVVSSCGKPGQGQTSFAGQAVAGFSDVGCVSGQWCYEVGGKNVGCDTGCTTMNNKGVMGKEDPWCATSTVNKNGKQVYVGGSGKWKPCAKEQSGPVSCAGGTTCDGTLVTGTDGQVVCGTDLQNWKCTTKGWVGQKDSCVCPTTTKPVTGYGGNPPCTDSDGKDFLTKGSISVNGEVKEDFCYTANTGVTYLFEAVCGDTKIGNDPYYYVQKKCEEGGTGMEPGKFNCLDGKCVEKPQADEKKCTPGPTGNKVCAQGEGSKSVYFADEMILGADCTVGPKKNQYGYIEGTYCSYTFNNVTPLCSPDKGCCKLSPVPGTSPTCEGNVAVNQTIDSCTGKVFNIKTDCTPYSSSSNKYTCVDKMGDCWSCGKPICQKVSMESLDNQGEAKVGSVYFAYYGTCAEKYPEGTWKDTGKNVTGPGCPPPPCPATPNNPICKGNILVNNTIDCKGVTKSEEIDCGAKGKICAVNSANYGGCGP